MEKLGVQERNKLLQAVMNQSRIKILDAVLENSLNVSQIAGVVSLDRSTVVYHLGLLSKVGLVTEETKPVKPAHSSGVMGRYFTVNKRKLGIAVELITKQISEINPSF
jgi:predicted transcriptional regulator